MADLQEYKCPNCGGALEFNSSIQKMKCPYCDSELDMSSLKELDEQLKTQTDENMTWSTQAGGEWDTGEIDQLSVNLVVVKLLLTSQQQPLRVHSAIILLL